METIPCTPSELEAVINNHSTHGANFVALSLCTEKKLLKRYRLAACDKRPSDTVLTKPQAPENELGETALKYSEFQAIIAFDYANNVNAQREREGVEGCFIPSDNWFTKVAPAVVANKKTGERYLYARHLRNLCDPTYTVNGVVYAQESLRGLLPDSELTDEQRAHYGLSIPDSGTQGVERAIRPFAVKLANVVSITVDKLTYVITPETVSPNRIATVKAALDCIEPAPLAEPDALPSLAQQYVSDALLRLVAALDILAPARQ